MMANVTFSLVQFAGAHAVTMQMRLFLHALVAFVIGFTATVSFAQTPSATPAAPKIDYATMVADPANTLLLDLTSGGRVTIQMRPDAAPAHVERIRALVRQGFYDGTVFHRVIEGFMAQGGDPTATGEGGSKLPNLKPEFNDLPHVRGAVAMARADAKDSANSQFYITFQPTLKLDRNYTVWGRVVSGMEHVDAIARGEPPEAPTKIIKASLAADKVPAPDFAPFAPKPVEMVPTIPAPAAPR